MFVILNKVVNVSFEYIPATSLVNYSINQRRLRLEAIYNTYTDHLGRSL